MDRLCSTDTARCRVGAGFIHALSRWCGSQAGWHVGSGEVACANEIRRSLLRSQAFLSAAPEPGTARHHPCRSCVNPRRSGEIISETYQTALLQKVKHLPPSNSPVAVLSHSQFFLSTDFSEAETTYIGSWYGPIFSFTSLHHHPTFGEWLLYPAIPVSPGAPPSPPFFFDRRPR